MYLVLLVWRNCTSAVSSCFGKYESTPRNGEEFKRAKQDFVCRYEGGESMLQLCQRIYNLLDDIKKEDKVYLLVAHNGISRAIESYVRDMSNEEFEGFGIMIIRAL